MGKRLSDTAPITRRGLEAGENHTVSTRKIEGGYIVSQSTSNPNTGEYRCTEKFTKNPPRITPAKVDGRQMSGEATGSAGNESLADTKAYLGKDV